MTVKDMIAKANHLKQEVRSAESRLREHKRFMVDSCASLQVGDECEVNGFAFEGKRMKIISRSYFERTYKWGINAKCGIHYRGAIIKKDGSLSDTQRGDRYEPIEEA